MLYPTLNDLMYPAAVVATAGAAAGGFATAWLTDHKLRLAKARARAKESQCQSLATKLSVTEADLQLAKYNLRNLHMTLALSGLPPCPITYRVETPDAVHVSGSPEDVAALLSDLPTTAKPVVEVPSQDRTEAIGTLAGLVDRLLDLTCAICPNTDCEHCPRETAGDTDDVQRDEARRLGWRESFDKPKE